MAKKKAKNRTKEKFLTLFEKHLIPYRRDLTNKRDKLDNLFSRVKSMFQIESDDNAKRKRFDKIIKGEILPNPALLVNLNEIFQTDDFPVEIDFIEDCLDVKKDVLKKMIEKILNSVKNKKKDIIDKEWGSYGLNEMSVNKGTSFLVHIAESACEDYANERYDHAGMEFGRLAEALVYLIHFCKKSGENVASIGVTEEKEVLNSVFQKARQGICKEEYDKAKSMRDRVHFNAALRKTYHCDDNTQDKDDVDSCIKFCRSLYAILLETAGEMQKRLQISKPEGAKNARRKK